MKAKEEMPRRVRRYKITSTGKLIDDALGEHTRLACSDGRPAGRSSSSVLNKNYTQLQIDPANLAGLAPAQPLGDAGLIDLIATIPFQHADLHAKDIEMQRIFGPVLV